MRNFLSIVFLILFCYPIFLSPTTGRTEISSEEQQLTQLQEVYRHLASIQFDFIQLTRTGLRSRPGKGTAVFLRITDPGKSGIMRWNYTEPAPQVILNDGKNLSIYTQKDRQLIVTSAAELNNDITYAFFSGTRDLVDEFQATPPDTRYGFSLADTQLTALKLTPRRPHPQIKTVQLWFDDSFILHRLVLEDHFDSITELTFTNIQINTINGEDQKQIQALLELNLPADTEIISQ